MESKEKQYYWYHKVNNVKIPVSHEVFLAIATHTQHIRYIAKKEGRCSMSTYSGCTGDCSKCNAHQEGRFLSIDTEEIKATLIADISSSPEDCLLCKEIWEAVFRISDNTAKRGKEIIELYINAGLNTHQIARELELAYSTVEYRLERILNALRKNEKEIF